MANYDALINIKLSGQSNKDLKRIEDVVGKINKPIVIQSKTANRTANKTAKTEAQILESKRAQQDMMSKTRRVGDLVQKQVDKGLKMGRAQEAIQKSALMNQQKEFAESEKLIKVALKELNIQKAITKEIAQQSVERGKVSKSTALNVKPSGPTSSLTRLTANTPLGLRGVEAFPLTKELGTFGPKLPFLGKTTGFGSSPLLGSKDLVGSPKNILDVAKQNVMPVKGTPDLFGSPKYYEAVNKEAKKVAAMKGNVLPVSGMKHIVGSPEYLKEQARKAKLLKGASTGFTATEYGPQRPGIFDPAKGDFSRLKDRQSRNVQGKRTFMNNRFARRGLPMPTKGFDMQSALISGAFPLLFGQGPIGAAAGFAGGGIGGMFGGMGGFAGGIAATAIVQQFQSAITAISELGKALGPFSQNTQAVTNALGLQGSAQQAQIQLIEQTKGKTAAFNAAMKLMANDIGQRGVNALQKFGESSRILGSQFTLLITKLQALGAGIANFVLRITGLQDKLKDTDAERVVDAAALRGNTEALDLQRRQAAITAMGSRGGEGIRKRNFQNELDFERQIFAAKQEGVTQAKLLSEESTNLLTKLQQEVDLRNRVEELMKEGNSKTLAEKLAKNEQIFAQDKKRIEELVQGLQKEIDFLEQKEKFSKQDEKDLDRFVSKQDAILDLQDKFNKGLIDANELQKQLHTETFRFRILNEEIANILATNTTSAIMGLIDGTKSLSESLSGVARQLASLFLNKAFGAMFGGIFQAEGGYNRAGSFKAFQYGGVVSSPTLGMIGEGGEPEYVIPSSKMDGAMARYSAGARGGAVIPGGSGASGTVAGSSGNTIVEYTGPVLNFNGDEYVPKSSVPQIISAAAKQGATLGQSKTLNTLKNSRSSRSKIGI